MLQRSADLIADLWRLAEPAIAGAMPSLPLRDSGKEILFLITQTLHAALAFGQIVMNQQAALRAVVVEFVQQIFQLAARHRNPQMIAGNRFDRVRFVQNCDVVIGQDAGTFTAQGQVGKEQRVIDNQQVGIPNAAACFVIKAVVVGRTFLAQAIAVLALRLVPNLRQRTEREVRTAAVGCVPRP